MTLHIRHNSLLIMIVLNYFFTSNNVHMLHGRDHKCTTVCKNNQRMPTTFTGAAINESCSRNTKIVHVWGPATTSQSSSLYRIYNVQALKNTPCVVFARECMETQACSNTQTHSIFESLVPAPFFELSCSKLDNDSSPNFVSLCSPVMRRMRNTC